MEFSAGSGSVVAKARKLLAVAETEREGNKGSLCELRPPVGRVRALYPWPWLRQQPADRWLHAGEWLCDLGFGF